MDKVNVESLVGLLTLEEKASLCSGADNWSTKPVPRLGIPSWVVSDGPHGLRKPASANDGSLRASLPATCFPSGSGLAASWNRVLLEAVGRALGREARARGVAVLLGPAMNIKRSPLCGRNFEYFSEDPYLAGELAASYVNGVQSQGVGTSVKHFAANNQEKSRTTIDAVVDERTLREIYLPAFETVVKRARPWTVMAAYNRVNGVYATENTHLLHDILKEEWGFRGVVLSDWSATNDRVDALVAGLDLEMPASGGRTDSEIVEAVQSGRIDPSVLDESVRRILSVGAKASERGQKDDLETLFDEHHELARHASAEAFVLLKNQKSLLPLRNARIAVLGDFADQARYQGGGSSHVTPSRLDSAWEEIVRRAPAGVSPVRATGTVEEACRIASAADVAVLFLGQTDDQESEGFDRQDMALPSNHITLLDAVLEVQPNVVVVLSNGSPITMEWEVRVPAILEGYLGGQGWGAAVAEILFGRSNPSGKLAETFPVRMEDVGSFLNFPGDRNRVEYREGVFVGYRYHDAVRLQPLFPFGHGLSYTTFSYGPLLSDRTEFGPEDTVNLTVTVTNTGSRAGAEVVQLYVADPLASVRRPVRELKGFEKVFLAPGQTKQISFALESRAFSWWSTDAGQWILEPGEFLVVVGASSRDLRSSVSLTAHVVDPLLPVVDQTTRLGDILEYSAGREQALQLMRAFEQRWCVYEPGSAENRMGREMIADMPLRNIPRCGPDLMTWGDLLNWIQSLNSNRGPGPKR